ncbi:MAG: hypothetical protein EXX96DRAFT_577793 [Benjaminiella poitrasii]|nr:MAG: hypothetical protein EXX96DRAFT_577793 [Benjaminiella poitrasii]
MSHVEQTRTEKLQELFNKYDERHAFYLNKFKAERDAMPRISRKGKEKATSVSIKGKQAIREETKHKNIDKELPEDDSTTSDGERINMEGDLPGKRLNAIKSVLRRLLLDKKQRDEGYQRAGAKIGYFLTYHQQTRLISSFTNYLSYIWLMTYLRYPVIQEKYVQYVLQFQYLRYSR